MNNKIIILFFVLLFSGAVLFADRYLSDANLRFSHKTHVMNNVTCTQCHIGETSNKTSNTISDWIPLHTSKIVATLTPKLQNKTDFSRPSESICLRCHFGSREKSDCGLCHLERPGNTQRKRTRLDSGFVFSHEAHTDYECLQCHSLIGNWETLDGNFIKKGKMSDCLVCHDGKNILSDCKLCHSPTPRPKTHSRNFANKHGHLYKADSHSCYVCHESSSCMDCHSKKPKSHTLSWTKRRHAVSARTNPAKCQACHSDSWVCAKCHN